FFFSSRRRHTRSKRDWSSDVCSSDLWQCDLTSYECTHTAKGPKEPIEPAATEPEPRDHSQNSYDPLDGEEQSPEEVAQKKGQPRSEERRVGKEGRSRRPR